MTQAQDSGDLEDIRVHDLAGAATRLLERAAAALPSRVALTLVPGADASLKRRCWRSGEACRWPSTTLPR